MIVRKLLTTAVAFGCFFPGMIWLLFELDWIENAVGGRGFVVLVLGAAVVPAYWAGRWLARMAHPEPDFFAGSHPKPDPRSEAAGAGVLTGVGLLLLALCTASWFNHERAADTAPVQVTVMGHKYKESSPKTREEWRLVVQVQGRREDVVVSEDEWSRAAPGERISMRMLNGALGYPVLCSDVLRGRCATPGQPPCTRRCRPRRVGPPVPPKSL